MSYQEHYQMIVLSVESDKEISYHLILSHTLKYVERQYMQLYRLASYPSHIHIDTNTDADM